MSNKFAVGEFADGNLALIEKWANAVQHRSASFDFPLHFALKSMCNNPGSFDMASLDHAGLAGIDPLGAVTFVENHDTDRGGVGGPIVRNKLLAYAYILTSEGYPCVFYRDYSKDKHCFGLKDGIDRLIWIHEHLAAGPTLQRFKDGGVFAFERLGGGRLLVGLNKDSNAARTIDIQTSFPPHTQLRDFADHAGTITTDSNSAVRMTIPRSDNGKGYVCFGRNQQIAPFAANALATTQDYEGASDLDIRPASENQRVRVCRVFAQTNTDVQARLFFDTSNWTAATNIELDVEDPGSKRIARRQFDRGTAQGSALLFKVENAGFHSFFVQAASTSPENRTPSYRLSVTYTAPQTI
jgi:alpha-amylase